MPETPRYINPSPHEQQDDTEIPLNKAELQDLEYLFRRYIYGNMSNKVPNYYYHTIVHIEHEIDTIEKI